MKPTLLITGATGFVGAHLIRHFTKQPYRVIALGRSPLAPKALLKTGAKYFPADLCKDPLPKQADIILHAAGLASDTASPKALFQANVQGTKRLITKTTHSFFVYISSSSVYPLSTAVHREEEPIDPNLLSDYGRSKLQAEKIVASYENLVILRPRAIYGTHDRVLLPRILSLRKGNNILLPCTADNLTSLTHVHNLILAIETCIRSPSTCAQETFNITDASPYQLREVVLQIIREATDRRLSVLTFPSPLVYGISSLIRKLKLNSKINKTSLDMLCKNHVLSIEKARSMLGYTPVHTFYNTYSDIMKWLKTQDLNTYLKDPSNAPWS